MSTKRRILFVDDETRVLDGLRRSLRPLRDEWDMTFVEGGEAALAALATGPYDMIVSDMRMPGMDGARLLETVKERYPWMARIALSGQTSKQKILQTVGPIHQYLAKPCDAATLKTTLTRVCALLPLVHDERLRGLVSQLESLPCLAALHRDLVKELQDEDASVQKVARIIAQDVGMGAKVLQLVNSSFFGVRQRVTSIPQAVALLGLETIRGLVLLIRVFGCFLPPSLEGFSAAALSRHSLAVGQAAHRLLEAEGMDDRQGAYAMIAGMVHDVGKLVLAATMPDQYAEALRLVRQEGAGLLEAEQEVLNATHAEVGGYLLGLWGFVDTIIETVLHHHAPARAGQTGLGVLLAVHVADGFVRQLAHSSDNMPGGASGPDEAYLAQVGLADRLEKWRALCLPTVMAARSC